MRRKAQNFLRWINFCFLAVFSRPRQGSDPVFVDLEKFGQLHTSLSVKIISRGLDAIDILRAGDEHDNRQAQLTVGIKLYVFVCARPNAFAEFLDHLIFPSRSCCRWQKLFCTRAVQCRSDCENNRETFHGAASSQIASARVKLVRGPWPETLNVQSKSQKFWSPIFVSIRVDSWLEFYFLFSRMLGRI